LLKFAKDRHAWLQWLLKAKNRNHLVILNYAVTSNHIHLLVVDEGERDVIPRSMQLVAGRTGQEYNIRKGRKGAFWEDRYHATAIESGDHLVRCIVYIDLNMVRAGVVNHPSEWETGGYNEIQAPRRKCALIAYGRLQSLLGFPTYDDLVAAHKRWIGEALRDGALERDGIWTESIAVGRRVFVETVKRKLGVRAKGRKVFDAGVGCELRESATEYIVDSDAENSDIGLQNAFFWDTNVGISS
jgi:putative transposase